MEFSKGTFWKFIFYYIFSSYIINFWTFCQGNFVTFWKKGAFLTQKNRGQLPFLDMKWVAF